MATVPEAGLLTTRELPIVAGHLALDFANTINDPAGPARCDHVATYPGLLHWCTRAGALSSEHADRLEWMARSHHEEAAAAVRKAHKLRTLLTGMFGEIAVDGALTAHYWNQLRPWALDALNHAEITPSSGRYRFSWSESDDDLTAMLWPVSHYAAELLISADLHRLKRCAGCPWLFLDLSKNSSRRWCAMSACGTDEKIRRYVARRAGRRST